MGNVGRVQITRFAIKRGDFTELTRNCGKIKSKLLCPDVRNFSDDCQKRFERMFGGNQQLLESLPKIERPNTRGALIFSELFNKWTSDQAPNIFTTHVELETLLLDGRNISRFKTLLGGDLCGFITELLTDTHLGFEVSGVLEISLQQETSGDLPSGGQVPYCLNLQLFPGYKNWVTVNYFVHDHGLPSLRRLWPQVIEHPA